MLRVKGISQTHDSCKKINFDSVKQLVEGCIQNPATGGAITAPQQDMARDNKGFRLENSSFQNKSRVVFDKRHHLTDGQTVPFGY